MLSTKELNELFDRLGTPALGRQLVEDARQNAPIRQVRFHGGNVRHRYPSQKMGRVIETESRSPEFRANIQYEFDNSVLEYYPQPCQLDLWLHSDDHAKRARVQHTPDFLLIKNDGIWLVEWKTEKRLHQLSIKNPERYVPTNGTWNSPLIEEHLSGSGIGYQLRSDREHPAVFVENLLFLAQYMEVGCPPVSLKALAALKAQFSERAVMPLCALVDAALRDSLPQLPKVQANLGQNEFVLNEEYGYQTDDLYKAISDGNISFDLFNEDIGDTNRAMVFRDEIAKEFYKHLYENDKAENQTELISASACLRVGSRVEFDGYCYQVSMVGSEKVLLEGTAGCTEFTIERLQRLHLEGSLTIYSKPAQGLDLATRIAALSPKSLQDAIRKSQLVEMAKFNPASVDVSKRTIQRYERAMREAGGSALEQKMALASKYGNCGKGTQRIPSAVLNLIEKTISDKFNTPDVVSKSAAFDYFKIECEQNGVKPCTFKSFLKKIHAYISDRSRIGKKAAYQNEPIIWYLEREDRIHGARPWQYVHIDHTQVEIFCRGAKSRKNLGKPWLSLAIDAESRAIVGFVLSFEKPSYRSCMMLIRDIVRRHNHLPEFIVLDNGKEFHSQSFTRLAEIYGITLAYRPAGEARFGTLVERMFGTTHSRLIHRLKGNTKLLRNPRAMSQAVNPDGRQSWTLYALHHLLDHYFIEDYGTTPHPAHRGSDYTKPVEHLLHRSHETGARNHRLVRYDTQLLIETCPEPRYHGPTREIDCQRGIKVQNFHYQSKVFDQPRLAGEVVQVRVDPWDPRFVYALVDNHWERCVSQEAMRLRKYTELERRYASEMAKDVMQEFGRLDPDRLTEWMKECDPEKYDPALAEQQFETIRLYDPLKMTDVQCLDQIDDSADLHTDILAVPKHEAKTNLTKMLNCEVKRQKTAITGYQPLDLKPNHKTEKESFHGYELL